MRRLTFALLLVAVSLLPLPVLSQSDEDSGGASGSQPSPTPTTQTPKEEGKDSAALGANVDYSKEAFVIELLQSRSRFENDGTGRAESTIRVRIQSDAGVQHWGQLRFGYNSANEKIEIPYVRVLKQDGSIVKAGDDAVQDLSAVVQQIAPVYTDYREKHVTVPGLRPGDILEYQAVRVIQTAMAAGQFWMQYEFDLTSIVLAERLEIDVPGERAIKLKTRPGLDPKITDERGRRIYRWTSSHLERDEDAKDKDEKDRPKKKKKADELPAVQLTSFENWEQVGRWYANLEKDRRVPSKEVRVQSDALTKGLKTDLEKVEALYDYVSTDFRYVSLSLGLGRYQPHAAGDVLHNQYGDCKDKHTLLAALLEAQGMHASAVLINSFRKLDPDVPSPAQFNHVITLLPLGKDEIWMDTTTEVAPFRMLVYPLRKKQGLVIAQGGIPHLEETPADPFVPDVQATEVNGKVSESGRLEAKVHFTFRGDNEINFRTLLRRVPSAQWKDFMDGLNKKLGVGGEVSGVIVSDPASTHEAFEIGYQISKASYVDWSKKKLELKLPLSQFNPAQVGNDVGEDTEEADSGSAEPFKIGPPNQHLYRLKLELAPRYKASIPVPVTVERDYGAYQSSYKLEGNLFEAERKFSTRLAELPPSRANDYRAFRRSVLADLAQFLTLESSAADTHTAPSDMKADELIRSGNEARRQGNYALAINLLNRAVEAEPKSKTAWNDLGLAYYEAREDGLAINAYQKQVEIDPFDQNSYNNLGRVYLRQRKYQEAEKWFAKQVEVNPLDKYAHANLGRLYVEWRKYEEAIPELKQAISITPNEADPEVRLGEAYLNLGDDEKAMAAFDKAVQISSTPLVWNNIAYQLSLKGVHLDVARRYAQSAITTIAASLRNISLDALKPRDLRLAVSLGNYWDTLGWVEFGDGNPDKALKYISSAWQLAQSSDEADHLGQIYAKRGDQEKAAYFYALSLNARRPDHETRRRLAALLGGEDKVDAEIEKYHNKLQELRTLKINAVKNATGTADFLILLNAGSSAKANVDQVKYVSGDDSLKAAIDRVKAAAYDQSLPDDTPVKIPRRGTVSCKSGSTECSLVLALPDDVSAVD